MIAAIITFSIRNRTLSSSPSAPARPRRVRCVGDAGRRHPRPVREPGDRLHRWPGTARARSRTRSPSRCRWACEAARRPGRALLERRRLFDDPRDLRRWRSSSAEARRRVGERLAQLRRSLPAGATPSWRPTRRRRADLLVHRRGRRSRPGPVAGGPGLVRPAAARLGAGRGRGRQRRRLSRSSTRSSRP